MMSGLLGTGSRIVRGVGDRCSEREAEQACSASTESNESIKPMHICFLSQEYPPGRTGGIGTSIRSLGRALVAQGHRVTVLGWGTRRAFDDNGVMVHFLEHTKVPRMGWLANRWRIQQEVSRLVREEGLHIVEAPDWCGMSAGLRLQCPLVIRCHSSATFLAHVLKQRVRPSVRLAEYLALRRADDVVAVSRYTARMTEQLFRLRKRIGVIPNGIDISQFKPAEDSETERDTIFYFGTVVRNKGVLDLCEIFTKVLDDRPRARLQIVGRDAADRNTSSVSTWKLFQQSLPSTVLARVQYLGPQPYDKIQEYVRKAAVCAFPSCAESLPLSWLEAMACQKPVVAYDVGSARDVFEAGVSGLLVPTGDTTSFAHAICELLSSPDQRRRVGAAARRRVESHFTAEVAAHRSVSWYDGVLQNGS